MAAPTAAPKAARPRSPLRAVALPVEHGGWGLTAEPVLLGLLVAPSIAGAAIGAAAVLAFLARTPLKVVGVDLWRHRLLARTRLAERVAGAELVLLAGLVAVAAARAPRSWWLAPLAAVPLVAVEGWFDLRSRSRRLVAELCGAVAVASAATAIALAGGARWGVAIGLWVVLGARSAGSIPCARAQVQRAKHRPASLRAVDVAQVGAVGAAGAGWAGGVVPGAAFAAIAFLAAAQAAWARRRPPPVVVVGVTELVAGLAVVVTTALAVRLA
jgi:hypothetical protein